MVWRLYMVYSGQRAILIVPLILLPCVIILPTIAFHLILEAPHRDTDTKYWLSIKGVITSYFVSTLILNTYIAVAICWRVWLVQKRLGESYSTTGSGTTEARRTTYMRIIYMFIESGMLYSIVMGTYVISWIASAVSSVSFHLRNDN